MGIDVAGGVFDSVQPILSVSDSLRQNLFQPVNWIKSMEVGSRSSYSVKRSPFCFNI